MENAGYGQCCMQPAKVFLYSIFLHTYFSLISSSTRVTVRMSTQETILSQVRLLPFFSTFCCAGGCAGGLCWFELSLLPARSVVRADGQWQMPDVSDVISWIGLLITNNWVSCADLLLWIWNSDALLFVVLKHCVWSRSWCTLAPLCVWNVECADLCQHTCHSVPKFRMCQQAVGLATAQAESSEVSRPEQLSSSQRWVAAACLQPLSCVSGGFAYLQTAHSSPPWVLQRAFDYKCGA